MSVVFVLLLIWVLTLGNLLLRFPFPPCRQGRCRTIDAYTWIRGRIYGREKWNTYHYWCRCGDEYVREGKRFFQVLPDGTKKPYMMLAGFQKWENDDTTITADVNDKATLQN